MFIVFGVHNKVKAAGVLKNTVCPVCREKADLCSTVKYMTPHVFFIPTFRINASYILTCPSCASVMELSSEKGKELERRGTADVSGSDMWVIQNNRVSRCPGCGGKIEGGHRYCPTCGKEL